MKNILLISSAVIIGLVGYYMTEINSYTGIKEIVEALIAWGSLYLGTTICVTVGSLIARKVINGSVTPRAALIEYSLISLLTTAVPFLVIAVANLVGKVFDASLFFGDAGSAGIVMPIFMLMIAVLSIIVFVVYIFHLGR